MNNISHLQQNISKFKRKYLINFLLKGISVFGLFILLVFLSFNFIEYFNYFSKTIRATLFFSFISFFFVTFYIYILKPYLDYKKSSSDEQIAKKIGETNPSIKDKLLNTIVLISSFDNELALASIDQRVSNFKTVEFDKSINMQASYKYATYLGFIILFLTGIYLYKPLIINGSTARIINFNKEYRKPAAFDFVISNQKIEVFENEDVTIKSKIIGKIIPKDVYIIENEIKNKVNFKGSKINYTIKNITSSKTLYFESAGIKSETFTILVNKRPLIVNSKIETQYPTYLGIQNIKLVNSNQITIPEGTILNFNFETKETEKIKYIFDSTSILLNQKSNGFFYSKKYKKSEEFELALSNLKGNNKDKITYTINIIKDLSPKIAVETFLDTNLFSYITFAGEIEDDYGISKLTLNYKVKDSSNKLYKSIKIPVSNNNKQSYIYTWNIDSLLTKTNELEYYLEVWDNDGVNGNKSTKTLLKTLKTSNSAELKDAIEDKKKDVTNSFDKNIEELKKLKDEIAKTNEKLKSKKNLNWQDKQELEKIANKQNEIQNEIKELSKEFEKLKNKQEKFEKPSEKLSEKEEQLQKLLDELLDDETKKMLEEMKKLLEKKELEPEKISSLLEEMQKKDFNLEKELERAKELFKKLKMEEKIEETIKKLDELAKKEENEAEKNKNGLKSEAEKEDAVKKQEEINKEFEKVKEDLKEIEKLNEESKSKQEEELKEQEKQAESIEKDQESASEELKKGKSGKASEQQESAANKMKKMSKDMQDMQSKMESEENEEDLKNLRNILNNLLKLSYSQESLMNSFGKMKQINPQFVEESSKQLKIKEDAAIIEDSLLALANRNFEIQKIVTTELFKMNEYIENSLEAIKNREIGKITGNQQFAMTSINNLALLLSEVMEQMQQQQGDKKSGEQMCNKPKGSQPKPSTSIGKKQGKLSQEIKDLKNSGKTGKEQSEQLAKLAAQQEQLRKSLKELEKMQDKGKDGKSGDMGKLEKLMKENEIDLINKRLTEETIKRQEEIITRLLQAEKAVRERDLDEKRESKTANEIKREYPPSFEKYLKDKEKEIELLKTINPKYTPYYKNKVSEYLNQL